MRAGLDFGGCFASICFPPSSSDSVIHLWPDPLAISGFVFFIYVVFLMYVLGSEIRPN